MTLRRLLLVAAFAALALLGTGCAAMSVNPWDRDLLARPTMRLGGLARETAVDDHIYFSKEGSVGGLGVGGGGCGCN